MARHAKQTWKDIKTDENRRDENSSMYGHSSFLCILMKLLLLYYETATASKYEWWYQFPSTTHWIAKLYSIWLLSYTKSSCSRPSSHWSGRGMPGLYRIRQQVEVNMVKSFSLYIRVLVKFGVCTRINVKWHNHIKLKLGGGEIGKHCIKKPQGDTKAAWEAYRTPLLPQTQKQGGRDKEKKKKKSPW